jgi:hypothetical protein
MRRSLLYVGLFFLVITASGGLALASKYSNHSLSESTLLFRELVGSVLAFATLAVIFLVASILPTKSSRADTPFATTTTAPDSEKDQTSESEYQASSTAPAENETKGELSLLELTILRYLARGIGEKDISTYTGVGRTVISSKLDRLYEEDYITKDNKLTEKSFDLLHKSEPGTGATWSDNTSHTEQPEVQPQSTSSTERNPVYIEASVVIIVLLAIFFLVPVVPYSQNSNAIVGTMTVTAQTSPSYVVFQCGIVMNPHVSGYYEGSLVTSYAPWSGTRWICGASASS